MIDVDFNSIFSPVYSNLALFFLKFVCIKLKSLAIIARASLKET
jgi:hypothetical protein